LTRPGAFDIETALARLEAAFPTWQAPVLAFVAQHESDPYRVLVSCILSLRTLDQVTAPVSRRLFAVADTPAAIVALPLEQLRALIRPVAFYTRKAAQIQAFSEILLRDHAGAVPSDLDTLLALPGVGRKTANLVLVEGHGLPGICVDTHVHRITNRWGYVRSAAPDETELRLRGKLPAHWWMRVNLLLVAFGQSICRPIGPRCSQCPLNDGLCRRVGLRRGRDARRRGEALRPMIAVEAQRELPRGPGDGGVPE